MKKLYTLLGSRNTASGARAACAVVACCLLCGLSVTTLTAQPTIEWDRTIGGNSYDSLFSLQQTRDGGYILGGYSESNASGDKSENSRGGFDYWVVKLEGCTAPAIAVSRTDNTYTGEGNENTVFLGYGAQSLTLTASAPASTTGQTNYSWEPATGLSSTSDTNPVFTPAAPGTYTYTVTATNEFGCSASASVSLTVIEARCSSGRINKVLVCHKGKETCIAPASVQAHLVHGCVIGGCSSMSTSATSALEAAGPAAASFYSYPTAFSERTTIAFSLAREEAYVLEVFDMRGNLVRKLADGSAEAGRLYELELASDGLAEGIYITRLTTTSSVQSLKVVLKR